MNIRKPAIIFVISVAMVGAFVHGECADWKLFYITDEGGKYFYDKEGMVNPQKDVIQLWFKITNSDEIEQNRTHVEMNCKAKSYSILEESSSDSEMSENKSKQPSTGKGMRRFPLESAFGSLWSNVCQTR